MGGGGGRGTGEDVVSFWEVGGCGDGLEPGGEVSRAEVGEEVFGYFDFVAAYGGDGDEGFVEGEEGGAVAGGGDGLLGCLDVVEWFLVLLVEVCCETEGGEETPEEEGLSWRLHFGFKAQQC